MITAQPDLLPDLIESNVLELCRKHHVVPPTMAQLKLGLSRAVVLEALQSLKAKGLVDHPEARTALWRAKEPRRLSLNVSTTPTERVRATLVNARRRLDCTHSGDLRPLNIANTDGEQLCECDGCDAHVWLARNGSVRLAHAAPTTRTAADCSKKLAGQS